MRPQKSSSTEVGEDQGVNENGATPAEGWRLEHAGYLFEQTGSVSRDKLLSSGQVAAVTGQIVGVYVFRSAEKRDAELASDSEEALLAELA